MSRYRDLGNAWWDTQTIFNNVHREHVSAAVHLVNGFRKFLEVPNSAFHYLSLGASEDDLTPGSMEEGTSFGPDGWFHMRFRIIFRPTEYPTPARPIVFNWGLHLNPQGRWQVRTEPDGREREIQVHDEQSFIPIYQTVADELVPFLKRTVSTVAQEASIIPQIAFRSDHADSAPTNPAAG
jgi:hypothetical protein